MGLENLNSIFSEGIENLANDFENNAPQHMGDTKFEWGSTISQTHALMPINVTEPILDTILRGRVYPPERFSTHNPNDSKLFILPEGGIPIETSYKTDTFDPRSNFAKQGTLYFNQLSSPGSSLYPINTESYTRFAGDGGIEGFVDTDYSQAGLGQGFVGTVPFIPLSQLGLDLRKSDGWSALYKADHVAKPLNSNSNSPFTPYHYSSMASRDKLNIRDHSGIGNPLAWSRNAGFGGVLGDTQREPYIVSRIPKDADDIFSGRTLNFGSRSLPIMPALVDALRITKFLSSPAGLKFAANQNLLARQSRTIRRIPGVWMAMESKSQPYGGTYNPLSTILAAGSRLTGTTPNILWRRHEPNIFGDLLGRNEYGTYGGYGETFDVTDPYMDQLPWSLHNSFVNGRGLGLEKTTGDSTTGGEIWGEAEKQFNQALASLAPYGDSNIIKGDSTGGDIHTLARIMGDPTVDSTLDQIYGMEAALFIESEKAGMPFYFKDMRDGAFITFRAYLEGLTENIVPQWEPTNYIGRSEPAYVYGSASRDITFTLKLYANTREELTVIYEKINRLTSLCYPEYQKDDLIGNHRMKPPLTKLRIGELYGQPGNRELMGFIETLNYTFPEEATWETEREMRVPKFILATITYRVIHDTVPQAGSKFYGFTGHTGGRPMIPETQIESAEVLKLKFDAKMKVLESQDKLAFLDQHKASWNIDRSYISYDDVKEATKETREKREKMLADIKQKQIEAELIQEQLRIRMEDAAIEKEVKNGGLDWDALEGYGDDLG